MIYFLKLTLLKTHFLEGFFHLIFYIVKGFFYFIFSLISGLLHLIPEILYLIPIFLFLIMIRNILEKTTQLIDKISEMFVMILDRTIHFLNQIFKRFSIEKSTAPIPIQNNPSDSTSIPHTQNESFLGKWSRKLHKN